VPGQVAEQTAVTQRIVHVSFGLDMGGLERLLLEIAKITDPRVQQLFFISLGSIGTVGLQLRRLGWPVVCLHRPHGLRPSLVLSLARMFHGIHPTVVHTHDARALIYAAPAARLMGIRRVIHTQHGQNLDMTPRRLQVLRFAASLTKSYVCVSQDAQRVALSQGVRADRLRVICNGIGVESLKTAVRSQSDVSSDDKKVLVAISRLSPEKDISTLLHAVALIHESLPELRLEVAGTGPCHGDLLREANQLGIYEKVQFLGQVSGPAGVLSRGRVFVLPSNSEGISLTLLEAMAAGVPVVATKVGGTPEVIEDGRTGVLVPPNDPIALADAIHRVWLDEELRFELSLAADQQVTEHFDIRRMAGEYDQLYRGKDTDPDSLRIAKPMLHQLPVAAGDQE
jgi:glycosyltransferase involved in cell wall biosynthesis